MTRMIECSKLKKTASGLNTQPYPGELGKKIFDSISAEAWQQWLDHQTMLINEHRLSMLEASARQFLKTEMENFLFGDGSQKPAGYVPPNK
jgi:Fe-S cluster protector protein